jgi:hypothetical protein
MTETRDIMLADYHSTLAKSITMIRNQTADEAVVRSLATLGFLHYEGQNARKREVALGGKYLTV